MDVVWSCAWLKETLIRRRLTHKIQLTITDTLKNKHLTNKLCVFTVLYVYAGNERG